MSPWRIAVNTEAATREDLQRALAATRVLFTSPAAVASARQLQPLSASAGQTWLAVGSGTAQALQRAGVTAVTAPARMDSEGLLALPALQAIDGTDIGLVTAPEGRNVIAPTLQARGARVLRADVYRREPVRIPAQAIDQLMNLHVPACLLLSSGGALEHALQQLPPTAAARLRQSTAVAASARLADAARLAGFPHVVQAPGPRPAQMLDAAASAMAARIR